MTSLCRDYLLYKIYFDFKNSLCYNKIRSFPRLCKGAVDKNKTIWKVDNYEILLWR